METLRTLLWGVLLLIVYLLWSAWQQTYPAQPPTTHVNTDSIIVSNITTPIPGPSISAPTLKKQVNSNHSLVHFDTDVLTGTLDLAGGHIVQLALKNYGQDTTASKADQDHRRTPFMLLDNTPYHHYIAQTGWIDSQSSHQEAIHYASTQAHYSLSPDQQELRIDLQGKNKQLGFTKRFILKRGSYQIEVQHQIQSTAKTPWQGHLYAQLQRNDTEKSGGLFSLPSYTGGAISSDSKPYEKLPFKGFSAHPLQRQTHTGWIALVERYFLSAWIPIDTKNLSLYSYTQDKLYTLGMLGPQHILEPGATVNTAVKLYAGPAIMDQLSIVAPHLDLAVDYGMLWFISSALFWLMKQFYLWTGNWGYAIVLVTFLIKLAFYGLSAKSFRSMNTMRKLQPRLQALKTRYGDDRQKIAQATMELYRKERINPLGGCLPTLVQLPVFIALYWVLLESVELRQAPFILWIQDLSSKDPFYILPILMGISAFIQQKLNPAPPDPTQAKVMLLFPLFMTVIFLNFPAGLVLYWFVNNTLSLLQQAWMLNRFK